MKLSIRKNVYVLVNMNIFMSMNYIDSIYEKKDDAEKQQRILNKKLLRHQLKEILECKKTEVDENLIEIIDQEIKYLKRMIRGCDNSIIEAYLIDKGLNFFYMLNMIIK